MGIEVMLPKFRTAYVAVKTPRPNQNKTKNLFKCVALFILGQNIDALRMVAFKALQEKFGADKAMAIAKHPKFKTPFKDQGTLVNDDGSLRPGMTAGAFFIDMANEDRPYVCGMDANEMTDLRDFYSGCYAIAKCEVYAWEHPEGGRGVSFSLLGLQKVDEGQRLGGSGLRASPADFVPIVPEGQSTPVGATGAPLSASDIPF